MRKLWLLTTVCCVLMAGVILIYGALQYSYLSTRGASASDVAVNTSVPASTPAFSPTAGNQQESDTCNDLLVLVDKTYALPANYVPPDLVHLSDYGIPVLNNSLMGRQVMIGDLQKLFADSARAGFYLVAASVYRSYADQASVYNSYVQDYGAAQANTFSAQPGHSQHQLGTAIDFTTAEMQYQLSQTFADTGAGQWLMSNAYKYGFYLAYPQGQESVTGYEYEPWHFRYIGVQNAYDLEQSGLIMQTYLEKKAITPSC